MGCHRCTPCLSHDSFCNYNPYSVPSRKRAHGWCTLYWVAGGPIFEVSVSRLVRKSTQVNYMYPRIFIIHYWFHPLIFKHGSNREQGWPAIGSLTSYTLQRHPSISVWVWLARLGNRAGTSPCAVDGSHIKCPWLWLLAMRNHSFVLKCGIRLSSAAVWQVTYPSYLKFSPH